MVTLTQQIKRGDTLPILRAFLIKPDGQALDPTGYTVTLRLRRNGATTIVRDMATGAADLGEVLYQWEDDDWDELEVGAYDMEYHAVGAGGKLTFPNLGFHQLNVAPSLE
jgi:hypothetical protein